MSCETIQEMMLMGYLVSIIALCAAASEKDIYQNKICNNRSSPRTQYNDVRPNQDYFARYRKLPFASQSKVSRVFTLWAAKSAKTVKKALKAAKHLSYQSNFLARAVVSGHRVFCLLGLDLSKLDGVNEMKENSAILNALSLRTRGQIKVLKHGNIRRLT